VRTREHSRRTWREKGTFAIKKIKPQVASRPALDLDFSCVVSLLYKPGFLQFSSAFVSFVML